MPRTTWILAEDGQSDAIAGGTVEDAGQLNNAINAALIVALAAGIRSGEINADTRPEHIRQIKQDLTRHRATLSWPNSEGPVTLYTFTHDA